MKNSRTLGVFAACLGLVAWKPYVASMPLQAPSAAQPENRFLTKPATNVVSVPLPTTNATAEAKASTRFVEVIPAARATESRRLAIFQSMEDGPNAIVPRRHVAMAMANTAVDDEPVRKAGYSLVSLRSTMD